MKKPATAKKPTEPSPARERLLDAAQRLMLARGFAATSVDEICAAAKLTKGSFFHYFESKGRPCSAGFIRPSGRGRALHRRVRGGLDPGQGPGRHAGGGRSHGAF